MAETVTQTDGAVGPIESKQESEDAVIDIIDTHIHLWNVDTCKRDWLKSDGLGDLDRSYDFNEYHSMYNNQTAPYLNLKCGIFMETDVEEADIDTEISEITNLCKNPNNKLNAMIVKLDLSKPTKEFVRRLQALKKNAFIVGIRKCLFEGFANDKISKQFVDNLKIMSADNGINWVFDIATNIKFLSSMEAMIRSVPNQIFVLDHMVCYIFVSLRLTVFFCIILRQTIIKFVTMTSC